MQRRASILLATLVLASACGTSSPGGGDNKGKPTAPCDAPTIARQKFRHTMSGRGDAHHAANDVIVAVGAPYQISAKLSYGPFLKDLQDEDVALFVGEIDCGPWTTADTQVTDDDGWVRFDRPAHPGAMVRPFHLIVPGDDSRVTGKVYAVAPNTHAVLFDIDGTLTTDDGELFEDLLGGSAEMRPGAPAVAKRWVELGYLVVYMTGRPYALRDRSLRWLHEHDFPSGPVFTTEATSDILPIRSQVGAFKRALITRLIDAGLYFEAAYGNAATDVCAYAEAGIDPARTWITEGRAGCDGRPDPHAVPSYVDHLPTLQGHARAP